jgi:hypothetical protein
MKMNQDIKREWVADLRSGEIHKGIGQLRRGDRMCVLGVLCNVHARHHPELAAKQKLKTEYMGERANLPYAVRVWAGLSLDPIDLECNGNGYNIIYLNDEKGLSFRQLAKLIDEQL